MLLFCENVLIWHRKKEQDLSKDFIILNWTVGFIQMRKLWKNLHLDKEKNVKKLKIGNNFRIQIRLLQDNKSKIINNNKI